MAHVPLRACFIALIRPNVSSLIESNDTSSYIEQNPAVCNIALVRLTLGSPNAEPNEVPSKLIDPATLPDRRLPPHHMDS